MNTKITLVIFLAALFSQCKKTEDPQDLRTSYYPLETGKYWIYEVDSVVFKAFGDLKDTFKYQEKVQLDTVFPDLTGKDCYRAIHYYRFDTTSAWKYYKTSCFQRSDRVAEHVIYDKRYVKLNFPLFKYNSWDVNAFNTDKEQLAFVLEVDQAYDLDGKNYPNTTFIELMNEEDFIYKQYEKEIYARNIGLIERQLIETETQNGKISGISYHKKLLQTNWP